MLQLQKRDVAARQECCKQMNENSISYDASKYSWELLVLQESTGGMKATDYRGSVLHDFEA